MHIQPTTTLREREEAIIEEFSVYDDWMDRYQFLVEMGNDLAPLDASERNDNTLIRGCQSNVWLVCDVEGDRIYYRGESDAVIVRGIVAMLISVLSGSTIDEVIADDFSFIEEIGLREHLSPTRSNGLLAMLRQMKAYAVAHK